MFTTEFSLPISAKKGLKSFKGSISSKGSSKQTTPNTKHQTNKITTNHKHQTFLL